MSSEDIYYVYILKDPKDLKPFYVGKGKGTRYKDHNRLSTKQPYKVNKIKSILARGETFVTEFYCIDVSNKTALIVEEALIRKFGRRDLETGILCNMTSGGGDGVRSVSIEERNRRSLRLKGKTFEELFGPERSVEIKTEMSKTRKGRQAWNKGLSHSTESKEKMRTSAKLKKPMSDETKQKLSKSRTGKPGPKGPLNGKAKEIHIFNNEGELMFVCKGNIKEILTTNNLPISPFLNSYRSGGTKINSVREKVKIFNGWYALEIPG